MSLKSVNLLRWSVWGVEEGDFDVQSVSCLDEHTAELASAKNTHDPVVHWKRKQQSRCDLMDDEEIAIENNKEALQDLLFHLESQSSLIYIIATL